MKLNVRTWGSGSRIAVLVHGIMTDSNNWWRVGPALAQRGYHVLAPDLRGHGLSGRGDYSLTLWADDLVETLPKHADVIVGHSLGCVLLDAAAQSLQPQRIIHSEPPWRNWETIIEVIRGLPERKLWSTEKWLAGYSAWTLDEIQVERSACELWDPDTSAFPVPPDAPTVPRVTGIPTLVQRGDRSMFIPEDQISELTSHGFEVRTVSGCSHAPHRVNVMAFISSLGGWL